MVHEDDTLLYRIQVFLVGTLIITILVFVWVLLTTKSTNAISASRADFSGSNFRNDLSDNPNVVARDMLELSSAVHRTMNSASDALGRSFHPMTLPKLHMADFFVGAGTSISHATGRGVGSIAHGVASSVTFAWHLPGNALGFVSHTAVSAVVKPAEFESVPVIDPQSPELLAAQAALPASAPAGQSTSNVSTIIPQWPIHGTITTLFGVPEPPYQPIHTGLDISDGHRAGVTPILPFRPGHVIETLHSRMHLGNEVIIEHGNGVTSVYGHLYTISVEVGQLVDESTVLGTEGSTGVSTGPHLHFEIRVNGKAVDPHTFISGQP